MGSFEEARAEAERLLDLDGVVGVGEGVTPTGDRSVVVMVAAESAAGLDSIPDEIKSVPVTIVETGIVAAEPADDGDDPGSGPA